MAGLALSAIVLVSPAGCAPAGETAETAAAAEERREAETYSLYSAYLDYLASGSEMMRKRKIEFLVDTAPDDCRSCAGLDDLFPPGALSAETLADFRQRAGRTSPLKPAFRLQRATYALAPSKPQEPNQTLTPVRVSLSPVGFGGGLTHGLFHIAFAIDDCKGSGDVLMEKVGALWAVAQAVVSVICE